MKRISINPVTAVVAACIVVFLLIQLVPYGHDHTNPPVAKEPTWDSQTTRELAGRACFDCHNNETVWLWYTNVAPASWLVERDVQDGRRRLNFSQWGTGGEGVRRLDRIAEVLQEGRMPPIQYLLIHPEARLTPAETQTLVQGLERTFQLNPVQTGQRGTN